MFSSMPVFNAVNALVPALPNVIHKPRAPLTDSGNALNAFATLSVALATCSIIGAAAFNVAANVPPNVRDNSPAMLTNWENMGAASFNAPLMDVNPSLTPSANRLNDGETRDMSPVMLPNTLPVNWPNDVITFATSLRIMLAASPICPNASRMPC